MGFVDFIKTRTPWTLRRLARQVRRHYWQIRERQLTRRQVFTEIYEQNRWSNRDNSLTRGLPFNSGPGSGDQAAVPYAACVNRFIAEHGVRSVLDLGCGDFRVGKLIASPSIVYGGVDIVEPLIQANQERFGSERVRFHCLDIVSDDLPDADLCLVRQVLQHLSNAEIIAILAKLTKYKWVIVTEDQPGPRGSFKPNRDKPHGIDSRIVWGSGVVLDAPPFNVPSVELLLELPVSLNLEYGQNGRISTFLIH